MKQTADLFFLKVFERLGRLSVEPRIRHATARWTHSPIPESPVVFGRYENVKGQYVWIEEQASRFLEKTHKHFGSVPAITATLENICPTSQKPIPLHKDYKNVPGYLWSVMFPKLRVIRLEDDEGWTDAYLKMDGKVKLDPIVVADIFRAYAAQTRPQPRLAAPAAR